VRGRTSALDSAARDAEDAAIAMPLLGLTAFLGAFLLFQVELLIGKAILPWYGGAPAVWTTCLLFFQALLLGGYAWAHALVRRGSPLRQAILHGALLVACLAVLGWHLVAWGSPLLPAAGWKPSGHESPVASILLVLAVSVGLPFGALAATAPLLQSWLGRTFPGRSPYRLYALSNLGSLMGLLSYPFVVEPALALGVQASVWAAAFALFAFGGVACAVRARPLTPPSGQESSAASLGPGRQENERPGAVQRVLWVCLPAAASVMLLAVTNQITQDVAVVPFLWVLPLSLYLISFVICFDHPRWYRRAAFHPAFGVAALVACLLLYHGTDVPMLEQMAGWSFVLLTCCMVCHGELARLAPATRHLTAYYLLLALGGALGGLFVAVVAPVVFNGFWEVHIGLVACGLLVLFSLLADRDSWLREGKVWPAALTLVSAVAGAAYLMLPHLATGRTVSQAAPLGLAMAALAWLAWRWRRRRWRGRPLLGAACLGVALMVLSVVLRAHMRAVVARSVVVARGFFGVLDVEEEFRGDPERHAFFLRHGRIVHGYQFAEPARRRIPTAYYGEGSGVALALLHHPRRGEGQGGGGLRIGVAGLGVGTVAAYGRPGDLFRFYEINPDVVRLANGGGPFTYLRDTPARVEVVLGDARVSLEREKDQRFDVLIVDAFSSGAIPVHLLTREAFAVYLRHLAEPDGILAVDVSNRTLDLRPVVRRLAQYFSLGAVEIATTRSADGTRWGSLWVLLTRDADFLAAPGVADPSAPRESVQSSFPLWTDDYSSLLPLLKASAWDPRALAARPVGVTGGATADAP
jgi:hypothetical protein